MGLLDEFNPIQMGAAILANNQGPNFGSAIGGGMRDYARMQQAAAQQEWLKQQQEQQKKQWEMQSTQATQEQSDREALRAMYPNLPYALALEKYKHENLKDPQKAPSSVQEYEYAVNSGSFKGTYPEWVQQKASANSIKINMGQDGRARIVSPQEKAELNLDPNNTYVWNDKGIPTPVKSTNFSEGQLQAAGYADRMQEASNNMTGLVDLGYQPGSLQTKIASGDKTGLTNYTLTPEDQMYLAAQKDWVRAKLRKESGAVIGDEEMAEEVRTYFPQPGDSPEVIEQKRQARQAAERGMVRMSGGAFKPAVEAQTQDGPKKTYPPLPEKPSPMNLKKGTVYMTGMGPLKWNGRKFEDAQ